MNTSGSLTREPISDEIILLDQTFFPTPWTRAQWHDLDLGNHCLYGWRVRGELVGLALFGIVDGDDTAHLLKVLLLESSRGSGAAQEFWIGIAKDLRVKGLKSVYLEVEAANLRAKSFYEKVGFQLLRVTKQYYSNGEAALIMSLTL